MKPALNSRFIAIFFAILLLGFLGNVYAQEGRGTIQGKVLDSSGGTVAGASVVATNLATNVTNTGKTDAVGAYFLPYLVPGFYKLSASAPGARSGSAETPRAWTACAVDGSGPLFAGPPAPAPP